jgi:hypothetical protein
MFIRRFAMLVALMPLVLTGCISMKSYVDPGFAKARYEDLRKPAQPYAFKVVGKFERNGKHLPKVDKQLQGHVERVLRGSGLIVPAESASSGEIIVVVNNVVNTGQAAAKGFGTGLTFGLAGSLVTDYYEMRIMLNVNGKVIEKSGYKHALHSTVGNKKGPEGLTPTTPIAGFETIVEQMLLNALRDVQGDGQFASLTDSQEDRSLKRLRLALAN